MSFPLDKLMALREFLDRMADRLSIRYRSLNYGGCGILAAEVALALRQLGMEQVTIAVKAPKSFHLKPLEDIRQSVRNPYAFDAWNEKGLIVQHAYVSFVIPADTHLEGMEFFFDVDGIRTLEEMSKYDLRRLYPGALTVEEMAAFSRQRTVGWNNQFDRDHQAYKLRKEIRAEFRRFVRKESLPWKTIYQKAKPEGLKLSVGREKVLLHRELKRVRRQINRINKEASYLENQLAARFRLCHTTTI